ncbi:MAG TPA: DNA alkylation repair protein [Actinoallomurus sp.]|jgi:3-methyladenine DNA glycosylase AlkC
MPTAEELLSVDSVRRLAGVLTGVHPMPGEWSHVRRAVEALPALGLSDRARHVRDALIADLPEGYGALARTFRTALARTEFTGWMVWPVTEAVAATAVASPQAENFDDGLALLAELTTRLTSEFALRTFLDADLGRTLRAALAWTGHEDPAVRRLASEGTRPLLPWAKRVPELGRRPDVTVPILDRLYTDDSEVVRRSVANHLNDIARADPGLAVTTASRWSQAPDAHTAALVRHAMRTLIKKADPGALRLLGFSADHRITVTGPTPRQETIAEGDDLEFDSSITNNGDDEARLLIDYVIHYRKANGATAPRVFKLSTRSLKPGETLTITRRHSFKVISTRRHHPGPHAVEMQVNGVRHGRGDFTLTKP